MTRSRSRSRPPARWPLALLPLALGLPGCFSASSGGDHADAGYVFDAEGVALLGASPTTQDFGSVAIGAKSAPSSITITNNGLSTSGAITTGVTGSDASAFAVDSDGCRGTSLPAGGTCSIALHFVPAIAGAASASLSVSAMPGGAIDVDLTGTGASPNAPPAAFAVAPASHDFGSLTVGSTSSAQTFTVTNTGGLSSGVPAVAIAGSNATDFVLANACTAALAPGKSCTFTATFKPSVAAAEGPATATVSATATTSASTSLTGTGLAPAALAISPTTEPWGTFAWGTTSADVTFTVTNQGGVATGPLGVSFTGSEASQFALGTGSTCSGATLAATTDTCKVVAHFAPSSPATGSVQASLTVTGTPSGTVAAMLSGDAEPPSSLAFAQGAYTLGPTTVDVGSSPVTLRIVNSGGVTSGTPGAPVISGPNASDFAVVANDCTAAVAPTGGFCTMNVVFTPQTAASESATIAVAATPGGTAQATLSGSGLTATALALTPDPGNTFASTVQGQVSAPVVFTLKNSGQTTSAVLGAPSFSGGFPADFAVVSASDTCAGSTLAQNDTCSFSVTFSPTTSSTETTTLEVTDLAAHSATDPLTATGVTPVPQLQVTPGSYTFPPTVAGSGGSMQAFAIKNIGTGPTSAVTLQNVAAPFSQTNDCPASLGAGASCSMTVTFAPPSPGPYGDTPSIVDTASDTVTLALSGAGVSTTYFLIVSPDPGAFGVVPGGTPKALPFTVTNYGQAALPSAIQSVVFSGTQGPMFSSNLATSSCHVLALTELQSCSLDITFTTPVGSHGTVSGTDAEFLDVQGSPYVSDPLSGSW